MENRFLYLTLNLATISIPFLASFYPRAPFYKKWKYLPVAIGLPAILFIFWDIAFVSMDIWGFNEAYLTGIKLINLPIEEWLFFICIPYACIFTYFSFKVLFNKNILAGASFYISIILIVLLTIVGVLFLGRWYTAVTFLSLAAFLTVHQFLWKSNYLGLFYFTYLFILIPFFIINGILTGSFIADEVVWYNNNETLGIRMGTIPVEDTFYGMLLILSNVTLLERYAPD